MTRVVLKAKSFVSRAGLEQMLSQRPDIQLVGPVASLSGRNDQGDQMAADVAVVEMDPEEIDDPEEVSSLASLGSAIVILVDRDTPVLTPGAVRSGVRAVLPKRVRPEELLAAVQAAAADLVVLPVQDFVSPAGWAPPPGRSEALIEPLTAREMEVLAKMSEGLSNKEISSSLAISEHTVKFHVASILSKLEATSRTEAVMQAIRKGLIMV